MTFVLVSMKQFTEPSVKMEPLSLKLSLRWERATTPSSGLKVQGIR